MPLFIPREQPVGWQLIATNPARGVAILKPARGEMRVFNPNGGERFIEQALRTMNE